MKVVVEERVHCLRKRYCSWKVVHIGESFEVVYEKIMVHENYWCWNGGGSRYG